MVTLPFVLPSPLQINQPKPSLRNVDPRILPRGPDFTPAFADFGRQTSGGRVAAVSVSLCRCSFSQEPPSPLLPHRPTLALRHLRNPKAGDKEGIFVFLSPSLPVSVSSSSISCYFSCLPVICLSPFLPWL